MRRANGSQTGRSWKSAFRWPAFLLINVALLLLVGISTTRESIRGWSVDQEIRALEAQAALLEGRKLKLIALTESLASPEQIEREARSRLGWKKEGERVVVLTGFALGTSSQDGAQDHTASVSQIAEPSHFTQWWNYFIGK